VLFALVASSAHAEIDRFGNSIDGSGGLTAAQLVASAVVSYGCGYAAYKWAQVGGRFPPETEAMIAAAGGLILGPIVSWLLFL
jgi:hypothetical protein